MSSEPIRVLVLYRNAILGEGLRRLIATDAALDVRAARMDQPAAVCDAFADDPEVVVLEDAGTLSIGDVLERTSCSLLLSVSVGSGKAWRLTRAAVPPDPESLAQEITGVHAQGSGEGAVAIPVGSRAGHAAASIAGVLEPALAPAAG